MKNLEPYTPTVPSSPANSRAQGNLRPRHSILRHPKLIKDAPLLGWILLYLVTTPEVYAGTWGGQATLTGHLTVGDISQCTMTSIETPISGSKKLDPETIVNTIYVNCPNHEWTALALKGVKGIYTTDLVTGPTQPGDYTTWMADVVGGGYGGLMVRGGKKYLVSELAASEKDSLPLNAYSIQEQSGPTGTYTISLIGDGGNVPPTGQYTYKIAAWGYHS